MQPDTKGHIGSRSPHTKEYLGLRSMHVKIVKNLAPCQVVSERELSLDEIALQYIESTMSDRVDIGTYNAENMRDSSKDIILSLEGKIAKLKDSAREDKEVLDQLESISHENLESLNLEKLEALKNIQEEVQAALNGFDVKSSQQDDALKSQIMALTQKILHSYGGDVDHNQALEPVRKRAMIRLTSSWTPFQHTREVKANTSRVRGAVGAIMMKAGSTDIHASNCLDSMESSSPPHNRSRNLNNDPVSNDTNVAYTTWLIRAALENVAKCFPRAIISGRSRDKVYEFVGLTELNYAVSHGMDIMGPVRQSSDDYSNNITSTDKQVSKLSALELLETFFLSMLRSCGHCSR
ncbi:hypothetical protein F3Y22_tig00117034pilonHSYRG01706 [Hibiscus syriacus]|uniref:Uncharacterized protein n=1 Tax=Hibiscus syriacus TaxID=106335 RepID=A0A6A2XMZ8_HIBSY|nr:hypothetical protein F3Y22_tig00117034pilonHSYRG01706 [Hibiscus syriacus]